MPVPVNVEEFEAIAREKMPAASYDYYAGAAEDEITLRDNREAFRRLRIAFRVLVDVAERDMRTSILGVPMSSPVILAPTAMHRMAHDEGERATARAAESTETLMCLSSISSVAMEEVAACAPKGRRWFQLYHMGDKRKTESLVRRAQESGYEAIVVTVDTPVLGRRERDLRHPQVIPDGVTAVHFAPEPDARRAPDEERQIGNFINQPFLTWNDLAWLRSLTDLPLIPKGVVRADDAKRCIDEGMAGIWISNHGGRQLDTSIATADALPSVARAVAGQVPVIVDGGIRRGTDVVKALALGADAVAIGRPQLWGLAADGESGVRAVLTLLRNELSMAMALAGCKNLAEIDESLLAM
jgi:4-hydroxymandelate oxidase